MATPTFQFKSSAYAAGTFTVVDFQGSEAISSLYRFEIGLKCDAGTAVDLKKVYQSLNSRLSLEKRETEITALVSAIAGVFTLLAGLLSLLWFNRIL